MKRKEDILKEKAGFYQFTGGWSFEDSQKLIKCMYDAMEEYANQFKLPTVRGVMLTDAQNYEIAQKFYKYCYVQPNDDLAIGANAIPLIFDECMKVLAKNKLKK